MTRIAQDGDRVRLLGGQYAEDVGAVGTVSVKWKDSSYADVKTALGNTWTVYRDPEDENEDGKWQFVLAEATLSSVEPSSSFESKVDEVMAEVKAKLIAKNNQYGNAALEPIRAFSKLGPVEQLLIRIDDKISRLQKGDGTGDEDAEADTLGYLILLAIARKGNHA